MRKLKSKSNYKIKIFFLAISFTFACISPSIGSNTNSESWQPTPPPTDQPSWGILQTGNANSFAGNGSSALLSFKSNSYGRNFGTPTQVTKCSSFPSTECPIDQYQTYLSAFGMCSKDLLTDCISQIQAYKEDGTKLEASYFKDIPGDDGFQFKGNRAVSLPNGSSPFIVDIPGAEHSNGTKYLIDAIMYGDRLPNEQKFQLGGFDAQIYAVSMVNGKYSYQVPALNPDAYGVLGVHSSYGPTDPSCVQVNLNLCAKKETLPLNIRFTITFKFSTPINGWFHGRTSNVTASIETDSDNNQIVKISANSVQVPTIFGWVTKESAPVELSNFYRLKPLELVNQGSGYCQGQNNCTPLTWPSVLRSTDPSEEGIKEINLWLPILHDTAINTSSIWDIRSMGGQIDSKCTLRNDMISGIVSTNATSYISGPPNYDSKNGTLNYIVVAPHFLPDGVSFKGSYDLIIRSDLARCIYGFSSAPVKATVSVTSSSGQNQIATTTFTENDGFMHLSANGFEFSNPTLQVKLVQDLPKIESTPTPTPSPSVIVQPTSKTVTPQISKPTPAKTTITCIKGKTIKKIIAVNPKCPTGYTKK